MNRIKAGPGRIERTVRALVLGLMAAAAWPAVPARTQPAEFTRYYQGLPGSGTLFLKFCAIGASVWCEERRAIAYGQVCDPWLAHGMGTGKSGTVQGGIPGWPMRYAGWRCETVAKDADPPYGTAGPAEPPPRPPLPGEPFYPGSHGGRCRDHKEKGCAVWVDAAGVELGFCAYHHADGSCPNWHLTAAGSQEDRRRIASLPDCPPGFSLREVINQRLSCKIPQGQLWNKKIDGFAN